MMYIIFSKHNTNLSLAYFDPFDQKILNPKRSTIEYVNEKYKIYIKLDYCSKRNKKFSTKFKLNFVQISTAKKIALTCYQILTWFVQSCCRCGTMKLL